MNNTLQLNPVLNPMVKISDSCLNYDMEKNVFYLDTPDRAYQITGFKFLYPSSAIERMAICLSFMAAAAEAQRSVDLGRFSDNSDIFEPDLMQWCQENASEIEEVLCELEGEKP